MEKHACFSRNFRYAPILLGCRWQPAPLSGARVKRVLILTAGYGEGHNAAARALAGALTAAGADAEVRDLFIETYGRTQDTAQRLYIHCINRAPWLWRISYHALDRLPIMRLCIAPSLFVMRRRLAAVLAERTPDAVVSVYPAYGYLLDRLWPRGGAPFARHTLVTDSITVNSIWHRCFSDTWLVPNEDTAAVMRAAGVAAERIHATGFPVPPAFANRPARPVPGSGEPFRILLILGHGSRDATRLVKMIAAIGGVRLTVTTGRNAALEREIRAAARGAASGIEVHGWSGQMAALLMSHHIVIGKAGGAATQEALAACTPMIITKVVPGQEEGNAILIERHGCGAVARTPTAVIARLEPLRADSFALWHRWHEATTRLSRPAAASATAKFILDSR
jgi:processive 1,2-diacylglycerol beta-glucosyltransferase